MANFLLSILPCIFLIQLGIGARILVVPAMNLASHTKSFYPMIDALAAHGHHVSVLQVIRDDKQKTKSKQEGVNEIYLMPNITAKADAMPPNIFWTSSSTSPIGSIFAWKMSTEICLAMFGDENTRTQFDRIFDEHWDMIGIDSLFSPCGIIGAKRVLAKQNPRPLILDLSPTYLLPISAWRHGATVLSSTYPSLQIMKFDNSNFWNRYELFMDSYAVYLIKECICAFAMQYVFSRGHTYQHVMKGITPQSLFEMNDFAVNLLAPMLDFTRPTAMTIIDLDSECPQEKNPLPEPYASFVDDPESKGTILFAMGHFTDWTYAPPGAISAFIETFALLSDYRIIWQFAQDASKFNVSSNVLLKPWIPQMGILYHPKTKLFISHMGLKSLRESICAKVPVAAMPMFAEQGRNTAIAQFKGFGVHLDKLRLTPQLVYEKITTILNDNRYADTVGRLQDELADQIQKPPEMIASKTDFLLRHNNENTLNRFMKMKGAKLPYFFGWIMDTITASVFAVVICIWSLS